MVKDILVLAVLLMLTATTVLLWKRCEMLLTAVAKLANGHAALEKWTTNEAKDVMALADRVEAAEKRLEELPVEQFKEIADKEADFVDGLNNILNYSISGYGLRGASGNVENH